MGGGNSTAAHAVPSYTFLCSKEEETRFKSMGEQANSDASDFIQLKYTIKPMWYTGAKRMPRPGTYINVYSRRDLERNGYPLCELHKRMYANDLKRCVKHPDE
jgi:hypothetical protein